MLECHDFLTHAISIKIILILEQQNLALLLYPK